METKTETNTNVTAKEYERISLMPIYSANRYAKAISCFTRLNACLLTLVISKNCQAQSYAFHIPHLIYKVEKPANEDSRRKPEALVAGRQTNLKGGSNSIQKSGTVTGITTRSGNQSANAGDKTASNLLVDKKQSDRNTGQPTSHGITEIRDPKNKEQNSTGTDGGPRFDVISDETLLTVLRTVSDKAGVSIIPDDSVKDIPVSLNLVNTDIESFFKRVAGGYYWKKRTDGSYIVSAATPDARFFLDFVKVINYNPRNQTADSILQLLSPDILKYVKGDKTTNLITITAPEDRAPQILKVVKAVDSRVRQFVVEALITELNGGKTEDYGFSWNWHNFGVDNSLGLNYARATSTDVATLKNLIGTQKATLRANPRVAAFEGRETQLNVGTETYLTIQTGYLSLQTATIQKITTGVTLKFTGLIGEDGTLTLMIDAEVGDFTTPVNGYPTVTSRKAHTSLRAKSGETFVIGGLIQDSDSSITNKVPILSEIPGIGKFFQTRSKMRKRTDIVMMLTPRLTEDGAELDGSIRDTPLHSDRPSVAPERSPVRVQSNSSDFVETALLKQKKSAIQIHCSNYNYTSTGSGEWQQDNFYHGGKILTLRRGFVTNADDGDLYSSLRSGDKKFGYRIPVPNGNYLLNLGFVEPTCTSPGQRIFDVSANGQPIFTDLDVFAATGGQGRVLIKSKMVTVKDGRLDLDLSGSVLAPILSTIQLVPLQ